jgi:hypothetical protein
VAFAWCSRGTATIDDGAPPPHELRVYADKYSDGFKRIQAGYEASGLRRLRKL